MRITKDRGITLIALIITIIILIILAGVSITLLVGSDGLLSKARNAAEKNKIAAAKEQVELLLMDYKMEFFEKKDATGEAKDYIVEKLKNGVTIKDYYVQVSDDGKVEVYKGNDDSGDKILTGTIQENGSIVWDDEIITGDNEKPGDTENPGDTEDPKEGEPPLISLGSNGSTTLSNTANVTVTITDDSGLATGAEIKYGWSTSASSEPTSYTIEKIDNYEEGDKSISFTAIATELTGKYYLWVVPVTLKDINGNIQTQGVISSGTFYLDGEGPKISFTDDIIVNVNTTINETYIRNNSTITDNLTSETNVKINNMEVKKSTNEVVEQTLSGYDVYAINFDLEDESGNITNVTWKITTKPTIAITLTNMLADPGFENGTSWSYMNITRQTDEKVSGSYGIKFNATGNGTAKLSQTIAKPVANHTYYGSRMVKTVGGAATFVDARFEMWRSDATNSCYNFDSNTGDFPDWTRKSGIVTPSQPYNATNWTLRSFQNTRTNSSSGIMYQDEYMVIDLTNGFGSNVPTKAWMDKMVPYFEGTQSFTW